MCEREHDLFQSLHFFESICYEYNKKYSKKLLMQSLTYFLFIRGL